MTDQEINEAVAKKLGWRITKVSDMVDPLGSRFFHSLKGQSLDLPNYCHSIEAAWGIVEYLHAKGKSIELQHSPWTKTIADEKEFYSVRFDENDMPVSAETAPKAICLAFLELP